MVEIIPRESYCKGKYFKGNLLHMRGNSRGFSTSSDTIVKLGVGRKVTPHFDDIALV
jgi:hypothetical protein